MKNIIFINSKVLIITLNISAFSFQKKKKKVQNKIISQDSKCF